MYAGCCNNKLLARQRLLLERGGESAIEILMGAWFDHNMAWIFEEVTFWRSHLSASMFYEVEKTTCSLFQTRDGIAKCQTCFGLVEIFSEGIHAFWPSWMSSNGYLVPG